MRNLDVLFGLAMGLALGLVFMWAWMNYKLDLLEADNTYLCKQLEDVLDDASRHQVCADVEPPIWERYPIATFSDWAGTYPIERDPRKFN